MKQTIRSFIILPLFIVALVSSLALLLSLGNTRNAQGQTAPPTSTVPPTRSPLPTPPPTPIRRPIAPTPRPIQISDGRVRANGWILEEVIGNRLSSTIYGLAIAPRLYRSDDNGSSWVLVRRNPEIDAFLMSAADADVLYSALPIACEDDADVGTLYRSENGGFSWFALNQGFELRPLIVDPQDADIVIAAGCDGLYRTEDGGWSWSPLSTASEQILWEEYRALEIESVYYADGETPTLDNLYLLVGDEEDASLLLFSEDGGANWSEISPMDVALHFKSMTVDPREIGRVWLSEENGVWSTEDQGQYWGLSTRGLESALPYGLTDILLDNSERLFLGTGLGVYGKDVTTSLWAKLGNSTIQRQDIEGLLYTDSAEEQIWLNAANGVYRLAIQLQ